LKEGEKMGVFTALADNFLENEIKKMNNEKETKMVGEIAKMLDKVGKDKENSENLEFKVQEKQKIRDRINRLCEENIWL
jgi:hypothetical protein